MKFSVDAQSLRTTKLFHILNNLDQNLEQYLNFETYTDHQVLIVSDASLVCIGLNNTIHAER